jgi:hypothetical protein
MKYTSKYIIRGSVKSIQAKEAQDIPSNSISRQNTGVETAQAHSGTDHVKAVAKPARPCVAAPLVRVHCPQLRPALPRTGGSFNAPGGRLHGWLPKYFTKPTILKLYKKTTSSFHSSSYTWRRRARAPTFSISF